MPVCVCVCVSVRGNSQRQLCTELTHLRDFSGKLCSSGARRDAVAAIVIAPRTPCPDHWQQPRHADWLATLCPGPSLRFSAGRRFAFFSSSFSLRPRLTPRCGPEITLNNKCCHDCPGRLHLLARLPPIPAIPGPALSPLRHHERSTVMVARR